MSFSSVSHGFYRVFQMGLLGVSMGFIAFLLRLNECYFLTFFWFTEFDSFLLGFAFSVEDFL